MCEPSRPTKHPTDREWGMSRGEVSTWILEDLVSPSLKSFKFSELHSEDSLAEDFRRAFKNLDSVCCHCTVFVDTGRGGRLRCTAASQLWWQTMPVQPVQMERRPSWTLPRRSSVRVVRWCSISQVSSSQALRCHADLNALTALRERRPHSMRCGLRLLRGTPQQCRS